MSTKPKILCVDDDENILKALTRVLEKKFDIVTSSSIQQARNSIRDQQFAIVIADLNLPDGKGLEFLAELAHANSESIRVLLSGQIDPSELSKAVNDQSIHRLIIKPWDNNYLLIQILEAYQNHRLLHEKNTLARLAITDPITELNNHRRFQDALKIESQRALRHSRNLSLLMIDIDHFKKFNDKHGHPAGDKLLSEVAKRIVNTVRNLDIAARYGGEEFAIIMPDTSADDAFRVAERIRIALEAEPFEVAHSSDLAKVTVSIGVASLKPNLNIVEEADKALYAAKNSGRNRSVLAE